MDLVKESIAIIKKNQAANGAYLASPNLTVYRYCWFRDGGWIAHAMLLYGENESAALFHDWASRIIISHREKIHRAIENARKHIPLGDDFIHARYTVDGEEVKAHWGERQFDGLGVWLWTLFYHIEKTKTRKKEWIIAAELLCNYLQEVWQLPCNDLWEENAAHIHTSTLSSIHGGLSVWSEFFSEKKLNETCLAIQKFVLENCIYDGRITKYVGTTDVDASSLMCAVPFSLFSVHDPLIQKTVAQIVKELQTTMGLRRYSADTFYGGGEWIILACWLGWYYAEIGKKKEAEKILHWTEAQADENFFLPEQINPIHQNTYLEWRDRWGLSANPLLWSHAMYLILHNTLTNDIH